MNLKVNESSKQSAVKLTNVPGTGYLCFDGMPKLVAYAFSDGRIEFDAADLENFTYTSGADEWSYRFGETRHTDFDYEHCLEAKLIEGDSPDGADDRWVISPDAMKTDTWTDLLAANGVSAQAMSFVDWVAGVVREVGSDVDGKGYRAYYDRGLTPSEAVLQERLDEGVLSQPASDSHRNVELCIRAAKAHGEASDPDHEVGDLQDGLREMWKLLTPQQRDAFMTSKSVIDRLEMGLSDDEFAIFYPDRA